MGTACSCDAELEVTELDVANSGAKDCKMGSEDEDLQCDLGQDGILGCSSIGTIVKTRCRGSNTVCAVKRISKRNIEGVEWKEEVMTLQKLDHPHVCKLHETLEDLMSVYLIMELCQGGNLMNISNNHSNFSEGTVAVLVRQMASAVSHLHDHDIVHSDIRPENWLFEAPVKPETSVLDMTLKMIDFGFASKHGRRRQAPALRSSQEGPAQVQQPATPLAEASTSQVKCRRASDLRDFRRGLCCLAPEQLDGYADGKADVWALGVLSYFLLSGQSPFDLTEGVTTLDRHLSFRNARFVFMPADIWRPISTEAKNFVALCLSKDPEHRPTAQQMLSLPWMRLAKGAAEEELALRSPGRQTDKGRWPASFSKILPTSQDILVSLGRMKRSQILEKAAIIATARTVHGDELSNLQLNLAALDVNKGGVLPMTDFLSALANNWNVPSQDLLEMAQEGDVCSADYSEFVTDVRDFQNNMQDAAISAVFRAFDSTGEQVKVKRKVALAALKQESLQKSVQDAFPSICLDSIRKDLSSNPNGTVSFEELTSILRRARRPR
mmetsp:Transcript_56665/g.165780  ORF Transcript_56665/g.165780 Transcript_56665/m.165780 type:complete len:553 (+) Transcript_56665:99-1757(+)